MIGTEMQFYKILNNCKLQPHGKFCSISKKIQAPNFFNGGGAIAYYHYFKKCHKK